ncbi:MAG: glycosyltransferase [Bacteroidales bacterium]|nr:glycosyltransferase [Bacteroidales bacterium]
MFFMIVVLIIWLIALFIQLFYYLYFYSRIVKKDDDSNINKRNEPVSVIICAKNEAENIRKFLPTVLNQDYENFEVVVVNDCSEDDSQEVLENFRKDYPHLKVTQIKKDEKFTHGKKLALLVGIKAASNNILVFTDADCMPVSNKWLSTIINGYKNNTEIVIGYGGFFKYKNFLNKLIRYDAFFIALQYLSFAKAGIPYMGTGRNLSYTKDLFFKNKGFSSFSNTLSGDDDLFVNKSANKNNTVVLLDKNSFTLSVPKNTFKEWLLQKKRHQSTFKYYKLKHKILILLEPISRTLYYLFFPLIMFFYNEFYLFILPLFALRLLVANTIIYFAAKKLNENDLFYWFNIFDFIFIFVLLFPKFIRGVEYKWN